MMWAYAWKGFSRRKTRALLAISGLAISIALLVAVATISQAVRAAVTAALDSTGADVVIQKVVKPCGFAQVKLPQGLASIDGQLVDRIGELEGVANATGVLDLWAFKEDQKADEMHPVMVAGVDPRKKTIGAVRVEKRENEKGSCCAVTEGRYLLSTDDFQVMIKKEYAEAGKLKVGDKMRIGLYSFEIVGLLDLKSGAHISGAEAFIPLRAAQTLYDHGNVITTIFVSVDNRRATKAVSYLAERTIGPEAKVISKSNLQQATTSLAAVTAQTLLAISAIVVTLVLLLVAKTALSSVAERVSEIGILKATGWRDSDVSRLLTAESIFAGIFGGIGGIVLGIALAYVYAAVVTPALPASLASYAICAETTAPRALPVSATPSPALILGAVVVALAIGSISGWLASRRAARLQPAQALRQL